MFSWVHVRKHSCSQIFNVLLNVLVSQIRLFEKTISINRMKILQNFNSNPDLKSEKMKWATQSAYTYELSHTTLPPHGGKVVAHAFRTARDGPGELVFHLLI